MIQVSHVTFHVKPAKKKNKKIFNTITKPVYAEYKIKLGNGEYKTMSKYAQIEEYVLELRSQYKHVTSCLKRF